ncbi:putative clathrin assembly protein At1g68110 isoform X2 [Raphanus sativus]|uniref:Clathrin assembly protein At1g68110 isoform X2 n=1 Tax=Raphanus sativus TaxID=3726 RepID=A0A6J0KZA9_RAPSA|nr:putative clathrin assembly protein At1g68110 isoform X2 [Raphanus sativus]
MIFLILEEYVRYREDKEIERKRRERGRRLASRMKLWKRAAAAIKDRKSLLAVGFSKRTPHHNLDLEAAIIKATSHDSSSIDYSNARRVYDWIRSSPLNLKTLVHTLSSRVSHTRSWIVSLKSLMLLHGVLSCKLPPVLGELRRLPFDLSGFSDGHSCLSKTWGFNIFVRTYFAFLRSYSIFLSDQFHRRRRSSCQLERIEKLQSLLDLILQIRPVADNMKRTLILEAMDCVVIESINIYGRICGGVIRFLPGSSGKTDAAAMLKIVNKATSQGEDLALYFEFCKSFGVPNARDTPQFVSIPKAEVETIKKMIKNEEVVVEEEKAMVVWEKPRLETIITEEWESFEDDECCFREKVVKEYQKHPLPGLIVSYQEPVYIQYMMPDLITF